MEATQPGTKAGTTATANAEAEGVARSAPRPDGRVDDDDDDRIVLPVSEFSAVKETFLRTFKRCSELLFLSVSCALSCVLRSFRPLHKIEITGAVVLFLASRSISTSEVVCNEDLSLSWLSQCSEILCEDENGYVSFARTSFQLFLLNYRVEGIDSTHATIATICLLHLEIRTCGTLSAQPQTVSANLWDSASKGVAAYAAQFWIGHYRCVQTSRPDLTYRVHRIISNNWGQQSSSAVPDDPGLTSSGNVTDEALEFCTKSRLDVLAKVYAQKKQQEARLSAKEKKLSVSGISNNAQPAKAANLEVQAQTPSTSGLDMTNEAFEHLDLDESMYATSCSESEGWTELRIRGTQSRD
ncbi:hypothetical protein H2198_003909 [Neophaeococcomyces mojaviensis]|uniref:Uncharacterized protein n=1 Tax=Neophaeococcomyces mojaviensis TaxID=3383035 RepID=A0ACC3A9Z1_9EURO|nr:hypothetical protein H2198_003909 [Knufia sp. JES_112]